MEISELLLAGKEQIVARNGLIRLKVTEVQFTKQDNTILVSFAGMKSKQIRCDVVKLK